MTAGTRLRFPTESSRRAVGTERALGYLRLGGMLFGWLQTTFLPVDFPPGYRPAAYGLITVIGVVGGATLIALRGNPDAVRVKRVVFATMILDAALLSAVTLLYAFEEPGLTYMLLLVLPLEAGVKYEWRGAAAVVVFVALTEAVRVGLRVQVWDHDPFISGSTFLVMLTALIAAVTASLAAGYRGVDRLKSEFLALTSHELRTPLAVIRGYTGTLQRHDIPPDDAVRSEAVDAIARHTDRLVVLAEDLDVLAKLDAASLVVDEVDVEVEEAVDQAVASVAPWHTDGDGERTRIEVESLHGLTVDADAGRLQQILVNILGNARKHAPGSRVRVGGETDGRLVVLRVADDGPGILPAHRDRVFDRFYRAPEAAGSGSGLGLAVARELARAMGGDLTLDENWSPGACFVLRLPIAAQVGRAAKPHDGAPTS